MRLEAVLFDLDGTIIDTEKYYRIMWPKAAKHFGYDMSDEEFLSIRSLGKPFAVSYINKMMEGYCTYEELKEYRKVIFAKAMEEHGVEAKPGARELLSWIKERGITTSIVTASDKEYAEQYLAELDLIKYFDHIISAKMVEKGKPAPDVYLFACDTLGVTPQNCIAVEDSPNGIKSAHDAGCNVIMVPDLTPSTAEDRANIVFECERLDEIIDYITGSEIVF